MRRNMKAANEMESVRVMQGEYLDIFRTREKTGDIYMQTMPSDRARLSQAQDRFLISCWTCEHFEDHVFRRSLFAGARVRVDGLVKAAAYNGQVGKVKRLLEDGRACVKLPQTNAPPKELAVKFENLLALRSEHYDREIAPFSQMPRPTSDSEQNQNFFLLSESRDRAAAATTKTFLVCWPLSQIQNSKVNTQFSKSRGHSASTPAADLVFSDDLTFRFWTSIFQLDGPKTENVISCTITSLKNDQPLTNMNGPFLVSSCALLGRDANKCCTCITVYVCIILLLSLSLAVSLHLSLSLPSCFFCPAHSFSLSSLFFFPLALSRSLSLSPLFLSFPPTHILSFHLSSLNDFSGMLLSPSSSCMCTTPLFVFLALVTVTLAPAYTFCARVCLSLTRARSLSHSLWTTSLALVRSCSLLCSLARSCSRSRSRLLPDSLALSYVRVGCRIFCRPRMCFPPHTHAYTKCG